MIRRATCHREQRTFSITLSSDEDMDEQKPFVTTEQRQQRQTAMDWSSQTEQLQLDQPPYTSTYDIIDLRSSPCTTPATAYVPRTIGTHNQGRLAFLPMFPAPIYDDQPHLLLANVPVQYLSNDELTRRQHGSFKPGYTIVINNFYIPSSNRDTQAKKYEQLMERLYVDEAILDYNYTRLDKCLTLFGTERMRRLGQTAYEVRPLEEEIPMAMEFFLQMDVDVFYMKTFSNRNIQPSTINKGLFCMVEPEHRFIMTPCGNCSVCLSPNHLTHRSQGPVDFLRSDTYYFLNSYATILNAPVTCHTNGIIYVLKCPCGEYEYVGETSKNLDECLARHRQHGNRIIHEFLIGEKNILRRISGGVKSAEMSKKDGMQLYQHSARCPMVMQMFLDCYPQYWRFVPMTIANAQQHNVNYVPSPVTSAQHHQSTISVLARSSSASVSSLSTIPIRCDKDVRQCVRDVPVPPRGYEFTEHQRQQQARFFKKTCDAQLPDAQLDLYNASIITVLPEKSSCILRQFIASLFITHGETKLNSIGNLLTADINTNAPLAQGSFHGEWCRNLVVRPPPPLSSTATTTTTTTTTAAVAAIKKHGK